MPGKASKAKPWRPPALGEPQRELGRPNLLIHLPMELGQFCRIAMACPEGAVCAAYGDGKTLGVYFEPPDKNSGA